MKRKLIVLGLLTAIRSGSAWGCDAGRGDRGLVCVEDGYSGGDASEESDTGSAVEVEAARVGVCRPANVQKRTSAAKAVRTIGSLRARLKPCP